MPLQNIIGVDHAVIAVRDLKSAEEVWRRLGFTLSPRGVHSAHLGTANYTIMFKDDYLELLGILNPTDQNAPTRDFLNTCEGIERTAFTAVEARAGAAELKARGLEPLGPVDFGRPVDLPRGGKSEARFSVFRWPLSEAPGGMRIFACQHHTREAVWIAEIMTHANGVTRIKAIEILDPDPRAAAEHMARLIDRPAERLGDGVYKVASGAARAEFVFLSPEALKARHPAAALKGLPERGAIGLVLVTTDIQKAAQAAGPAAIATADAVVVPAASANGVVVTFVAA